MSETSGHVRYAAGGVLTAYIALAVVWSFVIPLGGGIDEPRHLRYVQIVAEEGRLPTPAEKQEAISHHPPLHYMIAAPVYLATKGLGKDAAWYALRLWQVGIGAATLVLVFAMVRRMLPERPWAAVVAMGSVALLPHFQLVSAILSNDITTALFSTLMLYFVIRTIGERQRRVRWAALAGLAAGLAALTRTNAVAVIPPALAAVAIVPILHARNDSQATDEPPRSSRVLRNVIAFGAPCVLTGGVWLTRHIAIWGGIDPDPPWPEYTWPVHTFVAKAWRAVDGLFRSWWAQVGWIPGPHSAPPLSSSPLWPRPNLEAPIFGLAALLMLIAAAGVVTLLVRWLRSRAMRQRGLALATLAVCWLLTSGAVIYNAMYVNPGRYEGGRYVMPAVAAVMALPAIGALALPRRWRIAFRVALLTLLAAMTAISFWEMHVYLIPTFAK